jgi:hypothetical protein
MHAASRAIYLDLTEINTFLRRGDKMFNHATDAKAFVMAACALAIALLTIGMSINSTWAGSDQPSRLKFTPISTDVVVHPAPRSMRRGGIQYADDCFKSGDRPGAGNLCNKCCSGGCKPGTESAPVCQ